ncbi:MAG TPA: hypothetical protein VGA61_18250 [Anaerolineae bacterium]
MSEGALLAAGLAFLLPMGYALIAASGLAEERARETALSFLAALGLATLGYLAIGFALQFGGLGLINSQPGYDGLIWEWSALGTTWGTGWGMVGFAGWGLKGAAATPAAYNLALANLPWVTTTAMIPLIALRRRIPTWATGLLALLVGGIVYPLAGNWIWGGGWLANLGSNLDQGHGLVDAGGSGLVHLLGSAVTLAAILVFFPRLPRRTARPGEPVPLPVARQPLLAVLGAGLLLAGNAAWIVANPLLDRQTIELTQIALNATLGTAAGAVLPLLYTWFVAGRPDLMMTARGVAAGSIAAAAAAPFVAPPIALAIGGAAGAVVPLAIFFVDHQIRLDDQTAAGSVHGLSGILGLLAVAVFANGRTGLGWNGVGATSYLGVAHQGVTGLLPAAGYQVDFGGQLQAQIVGIVALALLGFFATWLALVPPVTLFHFLNQHPTGSLSAVVASRLGGGTTVEDLADLAPDDPQDTLSSPASLTDTFEGRR